MVTEEFAMNLMLWYNISKNQGYNIMVY